MFAPAGSRKLIQIVAICALVSGCERSTPSPAGKHAEVSPAESAEASPPDLGPPPAPRKARPDDWFEDVTERSGVRFTYRGSMSQALKGQT